VDDDQQEQVEEYLTGLSDDDFAKLLLRVRPPGDRATGRPGAIDMGRELFKRSQSGDFRLEV
jgi:hypothetical protein